MCNDRDPPWFNDKIRLATAYKCIRQNISDAYWQHRLKVLQDRLNNSIESSKEKYYNRMASKLQNTEKKPSKCYWCSLKIILNNKKISMIPPLFHSNRFISDFKQKGKLFNDFFFSNQCLLINNYSKLPTSLIQVTDRHLSLITFSAGGITKIIQNLNSNKAYGHDNVSIRMLKICVDTISKPLELIFKQALITGTYPSDWKKGNIFPVHKKGDK